MSHEPVDALFDYLSDKLAKDDHVMVAREEMAHVLPSHVSFGIPTGLAQLDWAIGRNGYPAGRIVEIYGFERCIEGDSFIQYSVRTRDGRVQNSKGGTIKRLYHRFIGQPLRGRGRYQRAETVDSLFYAPCVNSEGRVVQRPIRNVVSTGSKHCYELRTSEGRSIIASEDHQFLTPDGYRRLGELRPSDLVMVHSNRRRQSASAPPRCRSKETSVKHHPLAPSHWVNGYKYYRVAFHRLVYEAHMNQLTLEEYRERLNCGDLEGLKFLSSAYDVHHVDENPFNNTVENLIAVPSSEHAQLHAMERHNNLRFAVFTDSVANIKPVGARETYDIQMEGPEHNYVANQIVVHNCGKSALGMQAVAQVQRMGGNALWIETEHTFDRKRAAATGVDLDRLLRAETDSIEGVFRIQDHVVTGIAKVGHTAPFITVTDSITAVTAEYNLKHELAGESRVGLDSMKIKEGLRRLNSKLSKFKVTSLFINHAISTMSGWGNTSRAGGGHGLKLMASFRLQLKHKKELKDQNKVNYGQEILFRVDKLKQSQLQENDITEELIHGRFNSLVSLRNALGHVGLFKRTSNQTGKLFPGTDDEVDFNFRDWPQVVEDVGGQQDLYEMFLGAGVRQGTMQRWGDES